MSSKSSSSEDPGVAPAEAPAETADVPAGDAYSFTAEERAAAATYPDPDEFAKRDAAAVEDS